MITHWDIISSIRSKDNAISYALLIDGTEHDARLITKKLHGYVRAPQPASAPYVYRFALPDDLDEDTLTEYAIEAGADDIVMQDDVFEIYTDPDAFGTVLAALEEKESVSIAK